MKLAILIVVVVIGLLPAGCREGPKTGTPTESSRPRTTSPASRAALKPIDLRYGVYLARMEVHTTLSPDGLLRQLSTGNKSYGPNDASPKLERSEMREGRLTPAQVVELTALFAGWEALSDHYSGVPDGGSIQLRYGDKTVSGGSETPRQVWAIKERIDVLAAQLPVTER